MSTTLSAGTATSGAALSSDTSGILVLQSGSTPTTAITVDTSQNVTVNTGIFAVGASPIATYAGYFTNSTTGGSAGLYYWNSNTGANGNGIVSSQANSTSSGALLFYGISASTSIAAGGTGVFLVKANGNVQNLNNSYGALSDAKLKQNVSLADSQWNDVKSLGALIKKYSLISDTTNKIQIGWIAQDAQTVSPGLVYSTPDRDAEGNLTGTETLGVNYSVAYMKAFKALSEALVRIETLEAEVTALKAKVGV